MLSLRRHRQNIRLAVSRLQGEMVMSVPAATIEPEPQRIVLRRVPLEFETISRLRIFDRCPAFVNQRGKNLFAIALRLS